MLCLHCLFFFSLQSAPLSTYWICRVLPTPWCPEWSPQWGARIRSLYNRILVSSCHLPCRPCLTRFTTEALWVKDGTDVYLAEKWRRVITASERSSPTSIFVGGAGQTWHKWSEYLWIPNCCLYSLYFILLPGDQKGKARVGSWKDRRWTRRFTSCWNV